MSYVIKNKETGMIIRDPEVGIVITSEDKDILQKQADVLNKSCGGGNWIVEKI